MGKNVTIIIAELFRTAKSGPFWFLLVCLHSIGAVITIAY